MPKLKAGTRSITLEVDENIHRRLRFLSVESDTPIKELGLRALMMLLESHKQKPVEVDVTAPTSSAPAEDRVVEPELPVVAPQALEAKPVAPVVEPEAEAVPEVTPEVVPQAQVELTPGLVVKGPQQTVPERYVAVMGDQLWDVNSLIKALELANDESMCTNKKWNYVSAVLDCKVRVFGPDGDLKDDRGRPIKVSRFVAEPAGKRTTRTKYRAATKDEMQQEARKLLDKSRQIGRVSPTS